MSTAPEEFYSEERWENWLERIEEEDINPEDEHSARLLLNLQDDAAIAVVKIIEAYQADQLNEEEALNELAGVREIVLDDVAIEDEEKALLIDGVQTSLLCVFLSAEEYIVEGAETDESVEALFQRAEEAEAEEAFEDALYHCARAGTQIIDGVELDLTIVEELEYGFVAEWVNGLDSLWNALSDPEVVEE